MAHTAGSGGVVAGPHGGIFHPALACASGVIAAPAPLYSGQLEVNSQGPRKRGCLGSALGPAGRALLKWEVSMDREGPVSAYALLPAPVLSHWAGFVLEPGLALRSPGSCGDGVDGAATEKKAQGLKGQGSGRRKL